MSASFDCCSVSCCVPLYVEFRGCTGLNSEWAENVPCYTWKMLWGTHLHHSPHCILIEAWLVTCSINAPSPPPQHQPPPGSLGRQRAITMVIWTQIPHTPVHCDWRALRWEGTKCQSNRFFCVFVFASFLGGIVLRSMCSVTLEGLPERLLELGKQADLRNEEKDKEIDCKY